MLTFSELLPDFYRYLVNEGNCSPSAITNYISWLKFLDIYYNINSELSESKISEMLENEAVVQSGREKYSKHKDISNFRSSLRKFYQFLNSDTMKAISKLYTKDIEKEQEITNSKTLTAGDKESIIKSRIGQGRFRSMLIEYWKCCAITGLRRHELLVASHIKPWRDSDNTERIDVFNGLLLNPILDKLFDNGYITFDRYGHIAISHLISSDEMKLLNINTDMQLIKYEKQHNEYMTYHRQYIFLE